jgi:hypothetical protein
MTDAKHTNRDNVSGRYVDTRFDKVCVCGHTLGYHTAEKSADSQPCIIGDFEEVGCDCACFKKAKVKK